MTDEQFTDFFHRVEVRLERFETRLDALEKSLGDLRGEMREGFTDVRGRLTTLETRLDSKVGNWVVALWGATVMGWVSIWVGGAVALLKLWP